MKRIFIDTNVLLDVALAREPHCQCSAAILDLCETSPEVTGLSSTLSLANFYYILSGSVGPVSARTSGPVEKVHVEVGDRVRAGDIIAELVNDLLKWQLELQKAEVRQQTAAVSVGCQRRRIGGGQHDPTVKTDGRQHALGIS